MKIMLIKKKQHIKQYKEDNADKKKEYKKQYNEAKKKQYLKQYYEASKQKSK